MPQKKNHASNESRIPSWVWLFTGAILGAFIMFLIRLSEVPTKGHTSKETSSESDKTTLPKFDFYDLLRETKVDVPDSPSTPAKQLPAIKPDMEYILQVASFKKKSDAERVRAELILLNLDARIEQAKVKNGTVWHRILVGPFESRSMLSKARSTLISNKYEALVLKRAK